MNDDRLRVQYQPDYVSALGLAVFCFARCEWDASYCCERLSYGYIQTIEPRRKTANQIANDLKCLLGTVADFTQKAYCITVAEEFKVIAEKRNKLLHGKPCSAPNGDQCLSGVEGIWSIEMINCFSDEATECQIKLNDILYNVLTEFGDTAPNTMIR